MNDREKMRTYRLDHDARQPPRTDFYLKAYRTKLIHSILNFPHLRIQEVDLIGLPA